tara:strand:+ start:5648 stop:6118 length:471 start_codon:yes stop_codon:yes gene_type:complete
MRHAKATEGLYGKSDFDRVLDPKGIRDAELIGQELNLVVKHIDLLVFSSAQRTKMTADLIRKQIKINENKGDAELYDASPIFMKSFIDSIDDRYETVMIIGHNPTQTFLLEYYSGNRIGNLPTSGFGVLDFDIESWKEVSYNSATLSHYIFPKGLS